jgi:hypothetical protein
MAPATTHSNPQRIPKEYHFGTLSQHRHCWKNNDESGFLDPMWPREPDIDVVRKLAVSCLPTDAFTHAEIGLFAQGAFHRLYCISSNLTAVKYLMRVALPVDPFYKTESEVATMEYVRKHSSMPVPRIIAYTSSASNELGFEWILMEKVDGVPLNDVWEAMPFDSKADLTVGFAGFMKQLRACRFPLFGNLYFADVWNQAGYAPILSKHEPAVDVANTDIGIDGEFVVGRMVSTRFFRDKRLLLPAHRGPFKTALELVTAETKLLGQRIRHLSPLPAADYYSEVDEKLAEDGIEVLDTFNDLEQVMPRIFSTTDVSEDVKVLWHDDLSGMNILVDPESHKLTGVVDWESVSIVPAWETGGGVPYFLQGIEVLSEPPPIDDPDVNEGSLVEIRKDWEKVLLRRKYAEITGALFDATSSSETRVQLKQKFSRQLSTFEDGWEGTRYWLKHQFDNTIIASDISEISESSRPG